MPDINHPLKVFISYSRKDLNFVKKLASDLKAAGLDVWFDISKLKGGNSWRKEIEEAIRASQFVIVILSPDSIASKWVEEERLFASNLKREIIPLLFRQCELPLGYLSLHYIDVRGKKYQQNLDEILRALNTGPGMDPSPGFDIAELFQNVLDRTKFVLRKSIPLLRMAGILGIIAVLFWAGSWIFSGIIEIPPTPKASETPAVPAAPSQTAASNEITDAYGVEMIQIPTGEFVMGSDHAAEDEKPAHVLVLPDFYIDKYEVTNSLYKKCVDAEVCAAPKYNNSKTHSSYFGNDRFDNYPVIYVDWYMARTYCEWREARLPTEAEWEKAARSTDERTYPWGEGADISYANFLGFRADTAPVGDYSKGMSLYGVYDLSGNVWEWVSSRYMPYPYNLPDDREKMNIPDYRVKRGGSWKLGNDDLRSVNRQREYPTVINDDTGFRCARDLTP